MHGQGAAGMPENTVLMINDMWPGEWEGPYWRGRFMAAG
jgi:hypothetical protein